MPFVQIRSGQRPRLQLAACGVEAICELPRGQPYWSAEANNARLALKALRAILGGGLVAGVLDLTYALVEWSLRGSTPARVLQSIASGVLGRAAYAGGWATAALGIAFHFAIATGACAVYFAASRRIALLVERPVVCGALYGVAVYFVMQLIVLPLSAVPWKVSFPASRIASGLVAHVACVGLPIALAIRWADASPARGGRR